MKQTDKKFSLSNRMKEYEGNVNFSLSRRTPVIIRIDGKNFSNYTKKFNKPYDVLLSDVMKVTMQNLMDEIQGSVVGYTQSDELSLFLRDYDEVNTDAWYSNNIQKLVSIAASMATYWFNHEMQNIDEGLKPAFFDARAFSLPKEEVTNYFIYRQNDCIRNSIQSAGRYVLGHSNIQNLKNNDLLTLLSENGYNWNDQASHFKYGALMFKEEGKNDFVLSDRINNIRNLIDEEVYIKKENNNVSSK